MAKFMKCFLAVGLVFTSLHNPALAKVAIPGCKLGYEVKAEPISLWDSIKFVGSTVILSPFIIGGAIEMGIENALMPKKNPKNTLKIVTKYLFRQKLTSLEFTYFLDRAANYTTVGLLQAPSGSSKQIWAEPKPSQSHCGMIARQQLPAYDCNCYSQGERAFTMILGAIKANHQDDLSELLKQEFEYRCAPLGGQEREPCVQDLLRDLNIADGN